MVESSFVLALVFKLDMYNLLGRKMDDPLRREQALLEVQCMQEGSFSLLRKVLA